jgi:hypothetical protein
MKYFLFVLPLFILSSCFVINSGGVSSGPLLSPDDRYIEIAEGRASSVNILGFGQFRYNDQVADARRKMFQSRPLQRGEYYANFTSDISRILFFGGLVVQTKIIVTADVLESADRKYRTDDTTMLARISFNFTGDNRFIYKHDTLKIGDTVYYRKNSAISKYRITRISNESLSLRNAEQSMETVTAKITDEYFRTRGRLYGMVLATRCTSTMAMSNTRRSWACREIVSSFDRETCYS